MFLWCADLNHFSYFKGFILISSNNFTDVKTEFARLTTTDFSTVALFIYEEFLFEFSTIWILCFNDYSDICFLIGDESTQSKFINFSAEFYSFS